MHRGAAEFDGWWRVTAGVLSSDPARSRAAGPLFGIDAGRSYGSVAEMLQAEAQRADGIEAVAIMTPNDTHYTYSAAALDAGLDVVCDKLALQGEPLRTIGRGDVYLSPDIIAAGRAPRGHPEGLREAFANIYAEMAQERMALLLGDAALEWPYPRVEDGAHTMALIEAYLASQKKGAWVDVAA
jgi:predicted dehydrogenase